MRSLALSGIIAGALATISSASAAAQPITVQNARSLDDRQLAMELLGPRIAAKVIEVKRYEYEGSSGKVPHFVEFFTKPAVTAPRLNRVCGTDVITVEYNWTELDEVKPSTDLKIGRVSAATKYKAIAEPDGDPSSEAYQTAHETACGAMSTASDGFLAPSAGDAQWLIAIREQYVDPRSRFDFTCTDRASAECKFGRTPLRDLGLNQAGDVRRMDCPSARTGNFVDYCYRLIFYHPDQRRWPDVSEYSDTRAPKWILSVHAGMRDGSSPVRVRSLHLEHVPKPLAVH